MLLSQYYSRLVPGSLHRQVIQPLVHRLPEQVHGGDRVDQAKRFADSAAVASQTLPQFPRRLIRGSDIVSTIGIPQGRLTLKPRIASSLTRSHAADVPDELTRALYVDIKTYLPEDILALSDRLSMWAFTRSSRAVVDHELVELSARLPTWYKLDWRRKEDPA